jgi:hypothetical protein
MSKHESKSELVTAASALDAELVRFEEATISFRKLSLNSQKNLERATKMLTDLADVEATLGKQVQVLVGAIAHVRDRQMAQLEVVRAKADEINARTLAFQALLEQFKNLGVDAAGLNDKLQASATAGAPLLDLHAEMGELAAKAQGLAEIAKGQDFEDLARQADGLRQQILSARSKLRHLEPSLPS